LKKISSADFAALNRSTKRERQDKDYSSTTHFVDFAKRSNSLPFLALSQTRRCFESHHSEGKEPPLGARGATHRGRQSHCFECEKPVLGAREATRLWIFEARLGIGICRGAGKATAYVIFWSRCRKSHRFRRRFRANQPLTRLPRLCSVQNRPPVATKSRRPHKRRATEFG